MTCARGGAVAGVPAVAQCLPHDFGGDFVLGLRGLERPSLTLWDILAAHASTSKAARLTSERSMRRNALKAAVRSVALGCLRPGRGPGTPEAPSEQAS